MWLVSTQWNRSQSGMKPLQAQPIKNFLYSIFYPLYFPTGWMWQSLQHFGDLNDCVKQSPFTNLEPR